MDDVAPTHPNKKICGDFDSPKVVVLGAGVVGLSSAVCIQKTCPNADVTIMAAEFSPNTTSDGSGGFWGPYSLGETDPELIRQMSVPTHEHLVKLATSPLAPDTGTQLISGYLLLAHAEDYADFDFVKTAVFGHRPLTSHELDFFPGASCGYFYTTVKAEVTTYLAWLMKSFKKAGGRVIQRKVNSLSEVFDGYDVVVNCCGLGSKDLLGDDEVTPVRGQLIRVQAPWIKHFYRFVDKGDTFTHIFPGMEYAVVGGTAEKGEWNRTPNEDTSTLIWERAVKIYPQLLGGKVLGSWVGLRPARTRLRLDWETMEHGGRKRKVIHNYGHGGAGVTLHWGCAQRTASMVAAAILPAELREKS